MTIMKNLTNFKQLEKNELEKIKGGDAAQNGSDLIIINYSTRLPLPKPKK